MRIGIFSDVHANIEALTAVLEAYKSENIDKYVCIGDTVGYGASPNQCCDIIRKLGIAEATFYRWKQQYGGLEPDQARELKQLREKNAQLKKLVADLALDKAILQEVAEGNF